MIKNIKIILQNQFLNYLRKKAMSNDISLLIFSNDSMGAYIMFTGVAEKELLDTILNSLDFKTKNINCIDVGANIGNHSVYLSSHFKHIFSFEPQKNVYDVLKLNTQEKNISIFNYGLSESDKIVELRIPKKRRGTASYVNQSLKDFVIEKIILKKFDSHHKLEFGFIKIDVEGAELEVLKGMEDSICKNLPVIAFEFTKPSSKNATSQILVFLKNLGYENYYVKKEHISERLLIGNQLHKRIIRLFLKLFIPFPINILREVIPQKLEKDYNLLICSNNKSQYKIKPL